jgi:hypothetical protein
MKTTVFFATPDEIMSWVEEWRLRFGLHVGVVAFQPSRQMLALKAEERLNTVWKPQEVEGSKIEEIWINLQPLNPKAMTSSELVKNNPDCLIVRLPRMAGSALREADIGTVSEEREHLRVWKQIVADLKRKTNSGMWVVGGAGVKSFYKDKRFSRGIEEMVKKGSRLTNLTGLPVNIEEPQLGQRPQTNQPSGGGDPHNT